VAFQIYILEIHNNLEWNSCTCTILWNQLWNCLRPAEPADMRYFLFNIWKWRTVTSVRLSAESAFWAGTRSVAPDGTVARIYWEIGGASYDPTMESSSASHGVKNVGDVRCARAVVTCLCNGFHAPWMNWRQRWIEVRFFRVASFEGLRRVSCAHGG